MSSTELELDRPLDPREIEEISVKLGYASADVTRFRIDPDRPDRIEYALAPGSDGERARNALSEVVKAVRAGLRRGKTRVLWSRRLRAAPRGDVRDALLRRGLLAELGRGQVALGGELLLLAEGIDRAVLSIAGRWSPLRYDYPTLIPFEVLVRGRYLESFPQYITFACHLREDLEVLRRVVAGAGAPDKPRVAGEMEIVSHASLGPLDHVLSPAVCLHAYAQFEGTAFADPTAIAARARCARYEGKGLGGPERLWEFSMREIIYFGRPAWVETAREDALRLSIELAERLELSGRAETATDAFFVDGFERLAAFQRAFDTKYELRLDLPASGGSLAAASFNLHHDHFARCFGLRNEDGTPLATGCVGFGLERFAYAVACQHGADPAGWPEFAHELVHAAEGQPLIAFPVLEDIP